MKIEPFAMERMQSTWENLVELDMSESGVRPVTLQANYLLALALLREGDVPGSHLGLEGLIRDV